MKKVLIGVGILLAVLVIAVIAVPFLVPVDTYKGEIEQRVEAATGRKLTIAGPVKFSLLPSLAVVAKDVRFANAPGAAEANMATLAGLEVKLKLMPLLSGEVAIDSFVLDKPVIVLETNKQGRGNWQFAETAQKPGAAQSAPGAPAATSDSGGGLNELRLDNVRLNDGKLTYRDGQSGTAFTVEAINVALSLPDLDSPFRADGGLTWNGKPVKLRAEVNNPRALIEGKASALSATVNADLVRLEFNGSAANSQPLKLDGGVDVAVPNVRSLAAWFGQKLDVPGSGLGPFALKGKLALAGPKMGFTGAELSLDAIRATGDVSVDTGGKVPFVKAKLETNTLDLNPYLPPSTATPARTAAPAPGAAAPTPRADAGWSTEPFDFTGLRAVDADLALGVEGLVMRKIKIGQGNLNVRLKGGKLDADLTKLALYEGEGKGKVTVDGSGKVPAVALDMNLAGVQAEPLLRDVMELDRISGRAGGDVRVSGSGASQADLMKALAGKGAIKFENGALKGVNLGAMMRNVSTAFLDAQAGRAQQTDFSELSGTYVIDKGILTNDDLTMLAPLLRVSGAGTVDLPRRTINYRLEPKLVASAEGQGGRQDAGGLSVPVVVSGPWDNISYKPDLAHLLKDPDKAIDSLRGILGGQGGGSGGGDSGGESGGSQPAPSSPVDQLRGLFGR